MESMENDDNVMEFLLLHWAILQVTRLNLQSQIMNRFIFITMVLRADVNVTTNSGMHS